MDEHYLRYLERETARLEAEIRTERGRPLPRLFLLGRLKRFKLSVEDRMASVGDGWFNRHAA